MSDLDAYRSTYRNLLPDIEAIWDAVSDHKLGRQIADWTDATLAVVQAADGVYQIGKVALEEAPAIGAATRSLAADGVEAAQAERAAAQVAREQQTAAAVERELAAAKAERVAGEDATRFPARADAWGIPIAASPPSLDNDTKWAINGYTGSDYRDINGALRAGDTGKWAGAVAKIDGAMAPLGEPVTVFRSAPLRSLGEAGIDPASLAGKVITDKGFMSTTLQNQ